MLLEGRSVGVAEGPRLGIYPLMRMPAIAYSNLVDESHIGEATWHYTFSGDCQVGAAESIEVPSLRTVATHRLCIIIKAIG